MPDAPSDMSEPRYVALMLENRCSVSRYVYPYRLDICHYPRQLVYQRTDQLLGMFRS
jgi:hypothetical protein